MRLYEIDDAIERRYHEIVDPETGEIVEDGDEKLRALEIERERVALYLAEVVKGELLEAKGVKEEAQKLLKRARTAENRAAWLRRYIAQNIGGQNMRNERAELSWRKSTAVVIDDEALIPDRLCKITRTPLKALIREEMKKAGKEVTTYAHLEHRTSLQIR